MIRTRRLVTLLLGAWLGTALPVDWILLRYASPPAALLEDWGIVQTCFAVGLFLVLLFGTRAGKAPLALSAALLLLTSAQAFLVMPRMEGSVNGTAYYTIIELAEMPLAVILAAMYLTDRGHRRHRSQQASGTAHPSDQRVLRN
jgi:hypothetical protein